MGANSSAMVHPVPTTLDFNKELACGECGALLVANGAALAVAHFTANAALISGTAVVGTLAGGSLFWLAVRIYDRRKGAPSVARAMTSDISYFTPAAISLGLLVYDPSLYGASHYLLRRGTPVAWSVTVGQGVAFGLFVGAMNVYRVLLRRISGKQL